MTTVIKPKRGTTTPTTSDIVSGEVAVDTSAQKIYINDGGTVKIIGEDATTWSKNDSFAQIGTDTSTTTNSFLKIFDHTFGTNETAHFKIELNITVVSQSFSTADSPNYGEIFVDLWRTTASPSINLTYFPYDWESTILSAQNNIQYTYSSSGQLQIWIYRIYNNLLASGRLTNLTPTVTGSTYDNVHVDLDRSNSWTTSYTSLGAIGWPEYRDIYAEDYWGSNVYATYLKPGSSLQLTSSSKYILMGDSAQIRLGGSSDAKIWYNGSANNLDIELESAAQSVNITDNGTDKFIFAKTGDLTVTGDIAVNGGDITSTTGQIALGNYAFDVDQTVSASEDNYVLTYDNTSGQISLEAAAAGGISNVVEDTTPQLGGSLDVNGNKIVSVSNGNIDIEPNGTGNVLLGNFTFDADQTVGSGQDNYVLTYDNSAGTIGLEAVGVTFQNFEIKNASGTTINITVGLGGGTTILVKNSAGTTLNTVVGPFINAKKLVPVLGPASTDQPQQVLIKNASGTTLKIRVGLNSGGSTVIIKDSAGNTLKTLIGSFVDGSATFL